VLRMLALAALLAAGATQDHPLVGTWKVTDANVKTTGPREVIIRADSSASWGQEHARWRLVDNGRRIMIAVGGAWETYQIRIRGNRFTLSGPELGDPVTLTRVGPATPRPTGVPVPPDPDQDPPAR
jgi:hypothetical protein